MTENCPSIIYEDAYIIAINKNPGELVQRDKAGEISIKDKLEEYIKKRDSMQAGVFLGIVHRIDRPASGVVIFAKTARVLKLLNETFRKKEIMKKYWAIVKNKPETPTGTLQHYISKDARKNRSKAYAHFTENSREASLSYALKGTSVNYCLLEIELHTGRHHQIRAQLAKIGCPVKGDLKYGFPRSNKGGGISLHARQLNFIHPVSKEKITIIAEPPEGDIFNAFFVNNKT